jgi:hypothetical protein
MTFLMQWMESKRAPVIIPSYRTRSLLGHNLLNPHPFLTKIAGKL